MFGQAPFQPAAYVKSSNPQSVKSETLIFTVSRFVAGLKRHPLNNEAYLFICKLVDGYSED